MLRGMPTSRSLWRVCRRCHPPAERCGRVLTGPPRRTQRCGRSPDHCCKHLGQAQTQSGISFKAGFEALSRWPARANSPRRNSACRGPTSNSRLFQAVSHRTKDVDSSGLPTVPPARPEVSTLHPAARAARIVAAGLLTDQGRPTLRPSGPARNGDLRSRPVGLRVQGQATPPPRRGGIFGF
jgi:hypothetical protein